MKSFITVIGIICLTFCARLVSAASIYHVAVEVSYLGRSMIWYEGVLGFKVLQAPVVIDVAKSPLGPVAQALFGARTRRLRIGKMTADNAGLVPASCCRCVRYRAAYKTGQGKRRKND